MINTSFYKTPFGELILGEYQEQLCLCDWNHRKARNQIDSRILKHLNTEYVAQETPILQLAKEQLDQYFSNERTSFDIPLLLLGTDFQQTVWNQLLEIPYGKTESYLCLSRKLNNEKAIRAVASANGANAISIFIPCHRIIGSNGELTGYAGGISAKKSLLTLENAIEASEQLELF